MLIIGGNFALQNGLKKQPKTTNTNSPCACIWEGLLSEGYLCLRFGGLIYLILHLFIYFIYFLFFGGGTVLIIGRIFASEIWGAYFFGGRGGAYYRNFTVFHDILG